MRGKQFPPRGELVVDGAVCGRGVGGRRVGGRRAGAAGRGGAENGCDGVKGGGPRGDAGDVSHRAVPRRGQLLVERVLVGGGGDEVPPGGKGERRGVPGDLLQTAGVCRDGTGGFPPRRCGSAAAGSGGTRPATDDAMQLMERLLPEVGAAGGYPVDLFVQTAVAAAERPGQARADLFAPGGAELGGRCDYKADASR
jgi:hypothetical protein